MFVIASEPLTASNVVILALYDSINPNLYLANEINTDNSLIDITMQDVVEVVIDEDITDKRLMQEMYMGRI